MAGAGQALPLRLQWAASVATFTQRPPQKVSPAPQVERHAPAEQTEPAAQALPQRPQCALALARAVSQPSAASPLQSPYPALQAATVQAPAAQPGVALGGAQAPPQRPQWAVLVPRLTSQPSVALPLQLA